MMRIILLVASIVKLVFTRIKEIQRATLKWFLRHLTNLCEMQRIAYGQLKGYLRIHGIEKSLRASRQTNLKELVDNLDTKCCENSFTVEESRWVIIHNSTKRVLKAKKINETSHYAFVDSLMEAIETIWTVKALANMANKVRLLKYDGNNEDHVKMLVHIWDGLMEPETLSSMYTRQWQIIGFQGVHPETDFRGAGLLALECFHYLVKTHRDQARQLLSHSQHPQFDYPLACVLIDMTFFCFQLLSDGTANSQFYNRCTAIRAINSECTTTEEWEKSLLGVFYEFVAAILIEFDQLWISAPPRDILDYGKVKQAFHETVHQRLAQPDCYFFVNVQHI